MVQLPISLESQLGEAENSRLGNFIADQKTLSPAEAVSRQLRREQLDSILATISPREQRVLELRFGLDGNLLFRGIGIQSQKGVLYGLANATTGGVNNFQFSTVIR